MSPLLYSLSLVRFNDGYICDEKWSPLFDEVNAPKDYTVVLFILLYASPLAIISFFYTAVIYKTWFRITPGSRLGRKTGYNQLWKRRLLKMLVTIIVIFALCWLPMHVRSFLYFFRKENYPCGLPQSLDFIGYFMAHANAALNPCVYFLFNRKYWNELWYGALCMPCFSLTADTSRFFSKRNPQTQNFKMN